MKNKIIYYICNGELLKQRFIAVAIAAISLITINLFAKLGESDITFAIFPLIVSGVLFFSPKVIKNDDIEDWQTTNIMIEWRHNIESVICYVWQKKIWYAIYKKLMWCNKYSFTQRQKSWIKRTCPKKWEKSFKANYWSNWKTVFDSISSKKKRIKYQFYLRSKK